MIEKIDLTDILNKDDLKNVNDFENADNEKGIDYSKVGRKKIADSQKKKPRAMMRYNDSDWSNIEKLAKIAGLKSTDWLRVAIQEKARKENIELS